MKNLTFKLSSSLQKVDPKVIEQKLKVLRHIVNANVDVANSTIDITYHEGFTTAEELRKILNSKKLLDARLPLLNGKEALSISQHKRKVRKEEK